MEQHSEVSRRPFGTRRENEERKIYAQNNWMQSIPARASSSLSGCMVCQNPGSKRLDVPVMSFSHGETSSERLDLLMLFGLPPEHLFDGTFCFYGLKPAQYCMLRTWQWALHRRHKSRLENPLVYEQ